MKVAINGFGRIGRAFFKLAQRNPDIQIVAINDLAERSQLEYSLKYDSVYGHFDADMSGVQFFQEKNPLDLPWNTLDVDVVVESTGFFNTQETANAHIEAGAKRVVISAPSKDAQTVLVGVNEEALGTCKISSNASCTTNATSPVVAILDKELGIEKAILNTVHGYTATQKLVDGSNSKDMRKGRAGALNIVPTSTGAAKATTKVHTQLDGKFDGIALRVPVPVGSMVDITFIAKRDTSVEEVNDILTKASADERWSGVFAVTNEPLVSTDIIGRPYASMADLAMTRVVDGNLVKVLAWYDNEVGYTNALLRHVLAAN